MGSRDGAGVAVGEGVGERVGKTVGCTVAVGVAVGVGAGGLTHPRKNSEIITMKTGINLFIFMLHTNIMLALFINND